jgi:hypothetical protein
MSYSVKHFDQPGRFHAPLPAGSQDNRETAIGLNHLTDTTLLKST